jgi:hypothetical protein
MDVITTHLNADFDGLASMIAGRKLYPGALLVFPGGAQEAVRDFLSLHDLAITPLKDFNRSRISRLILMDIHEPERLGPLAETAERPNLELHIYDHHPVADTGDQQAARRSVQRIIEPVGATATILIEQLESRHVSITPFEATVLALGLYEETGSFTYTSTTARDLNAAAWVLRAGADLNFVTDTLRRHLDPELMRARTAVFVVGGFVRDLLLGRQNLDVDLVVEGDGLTYARRLGQELKATVKTHDRFGTAVLTLPDGFKLDVATARTEYYEYPTALPTVERSSIKKDLSRRDFTINTLAVRLNPGRFGDLLDFSTEGSATCMRKLFASCTA